MMISIFKPTTTKRSMQPVASGTDQDGFTIVEIMVASMVFSVILIAITVGVIQFTRGYYRGINSSGTQTTAQAAMDAISQSAQFSSGGTAPGGAGYFCAGNKIFTYNPGKQFGGTATDADRGLYMMDNPTAGACTNPATIVGSNGTELLGKGMRVIYASITSPSATYLSTIKLKIAYGDPDLLCSPSIGGAAKGSCALNATNYTAGDAITNADTVCKPTAVSQFCSVVLFSNTVQQRLVL